MTKTKFFRLMGNADKTNCYAKKDYGIKHAFFVDPALSIKRSKND